LKYTLITVYKRKLKRNLHQMKIRIYIDNMSTHYLVANTKGSLAT